MTCRHRRGYIFWIVSFQSVGRVSIRSKCRPGGSSQAHAFRVYQRPRNLKDTVRADAEFFWTDRKVTIRLKFIRSLLLDQISQLIAYSWEPRCKIQEVSAFWPQLCNVDHQLTTRWTLWSILELALSYISSVFCFLCSNLISHACCALMTYGKIPQIGGLDAEEDSRFRMRKPHSSAVSRRSVVRMLVLASSFVGALFLWYPGFWRQLRLPNQVPQKTQDAAEFRWMDVRYNCFHFHEASL